MDERSRKDINSLIKYYKDKIGYNAICTDMNKYARTCIEQFYKSRIPAEAVIEHQLVNFMKSIARFHRLKKEADGVANKWQQEVITWLKENNLTEKHFLEQLSNDKKSLTGEKPIQPLSPQLNGGWKVNQRNSDSDGRQNDPSSSEIESPDSQKHNQRNSATNYRSYHHRFLTRKSSSPSQLENPGPRNLNTAEFNANLSIDTKEVSLSKRTQELPVKPSDRFVLEMKPGMFCTVPTGVPPKKEHMYCIWSLGEQLKLPKKQIPEFVRDFIESEKSMDPIVREHTNSNSSTKSLNGKTDKKIDSRDLPSTSQQEAIESSRSFLESKHDRKKKQMESNQSLAKTKNLKEEQQLYHASKLKQREATPSVSKAKEFKQEQQLSHASKLKQRETTLSVAKTKELKEEQQSAEDCELKHMKRTQSFVKGKELKMELQSGHGRMLKHRETTLYGTKTKELKEEQRPIQVGKLNLDVNRVFTMVPEARICDKNHIKRRDSPDQSAMIAITSSKKERTSVYHGGRRGGEHRIPKLQQICIQTLLKGLKQSSDPTKVINKNVDFKVLEPIVVHLSPKKLHRLEEEKKYLLVSTDPVWKLHCERRYKSMVNLKKENESWRSFFERCCVESNEKLKNLTASISASASKGKPDRQIKFTNVEGPPTKRQKMDHSVVPKSNGIHPTVKPLPSFTHPSNSRSVELVPPNCPKLAFNHVKPGHRTIKKDAPLMHKVKKTMGVISRIHRS